MWLFGERMSAAFDSFLIGLAGFLIVPWATLAFALAYEPGKGVSGIGWVFVALGVLFDVGSWGGSGRTAQQRYQKA